MPLAAGGVVVVVDVVDACSLGDEELVEARRSALIRLSCSWTNRCCSVSWRKPLGWCCLLLSWRFERLRRCTSLPRLERRETPTRAPLVAALAAAVAAATTGSSAPSEAAVALAATVASASERGEDGASAIERERARVLACE